MIKLQHGIVKTIFQHPTSSMHHLLYDVIHPCPTSNVSSAIRCHPCPTSNVLSAIRCHPCPTSNVSSAIRCHPCPTSNVSSAIRCHPCPTSNVKHPSSTIWCHIFMPNIQRQASIIYYRCHTSMPNIQCQTLYKQHGSLTGRKESVPAVLGLLLFSSNLLKAIAKQEGSYMKQECKQIKINHRRSKKLSDCKIPESVSR